MMAVVFVVFVVFCFVCELNRLFVRVRGFGIRWGLGPEEERRRKRRDSLLAQKKYLARARSPSPQLRRRSRGVALNSRRPERHGSAPAPALLAPRPRDEEGLGADLGREGRGRAARAPELGSSGARGRTARRYKDKGRGGGARRQGADVSALSPLSLMVLSPSLTCDAARLGAAVLLVLDRGPLEHGVHAGDQRPAWRVNGGGRARAELSE